MSFDATLIEDHVLDAIVKGRTRNFMSWYGGEFDDATNKEDKLMIKAKIYGRDTLHKYNVRIYNDWIKTTLVKLDDGYAWKVLETREPMNVVTHKDDTIFKYMISFIQPPKVKSVA